MIAWVCTALVLVWGLGCVVALAYVMWRMSRD